jgi:hypothetical protein
LEFVTPEGVIVCYQVITPEAAKEILLRNTRNRSLSDRLKGQYKRAMSLPNGWPFVGTALVLGPEGEVLDGQHRLWACVESGQPFATLVVLNVPVEYQPYLDAGRKRTAADMAAISKIANGNLITSAARTLLNWQHWREHLSAVQIGNPEVWDYTVENLGPLQNALLTAERICGRDGIGPKKVSRTALMAAYVRAVQVSSDPFRVNAFFVGLAVGNLPAGHPVRTLRQRYLMAAGSNLKRDLYFLIRTWNAVVGKESMQRLQVPPGGITVTAFTDLAEPQQEDVSEAQEEALRLLEQLNDRD